MLFSYFVILFCSPIFSHICSRFLSFNEIEQVSFFSFFFPFPSFVQRPCLRRGSPCQDSAGDRTIRRPDHCKEAQTVMVWSCLLFIRSGQNHLARHSGRGKKTRQTKEEVGRQPQGMDRPGVRQVLEGSREPGKMEETGYDIICVAQTNLAVMG